MRNDIASNFVSRLSFRMNIAHQSSAVIEPQSRDLPSERSHYQRQYSGSATPAPSTAPSSRSRASSHTSQPTLSVTTPQPEATRHIRFRGASIPQAPPIQAANTSEPTLHPHTQNVGHADIPPPSPRLEPTYRSTISLNGSLANSPSRIKVRDLNHIQSFASEEILTRSRHPSRHSLRGRIDGTQQYEISAMPVTDIIEMVAGLLTKITTTNDQQHEHLHRHVPPPDGSPGLTQQASSVLAFHGKNVPSITIASYLSRIHKYCPTTYEVFISLLIYFDRMTEMVNSESPSNPPEDGQQGSSAGRGNSADSHDSDATATQESPMATASPSDTPRIRDTRRSLADGDALDLSHFFVVDSFNIHRLVMAGVTCASKFFSDVFYTNSRYAKVSLHFVDVDGAKAY